MIKQEQCMPEKRMGDPSARTSPSTFVMGSYTLRRAYSSLVDPLGRMHRVFSFLIHGSDFKLSIVGGSGWLAVVWNHLSKSSLSIYPGLDTRERICVGIGKQRT